MANVDMQGNDQAAAGGQPLPAPVGGQPAPGAAATPASESKASRAWGYAKRAAPYMLGAAIFITVVIFLIRPAAPPAETEADNVAQSWNRTMARLGIDSVYPPQEDLFVGDVYLSLEKTGDTSFPSISESAGVVFAGKGVRIARLNMQENFAKPPYQINYGTIEPEASKPVEVQSTDTTVTTPVQLYLTGFPGVNVINTTKSDASWWQLSAGRTSGETEEISIPVSKTYSAPVIESTLRLAKFCADAQTADLCNDSNARKVLSFAFGQGALAKVDGKFVFDIRVSLIRQVFLTDNIVTRRYRRDSLVAGLADQKPPSDIKPDSAPDTSLSPAKADSVAPQASASYQDRFSARVGLNQRFERPVAFGMRRVSFLLPSPSPKP